jgi:hypothetical protein
MKFDWLPHGPADKSAWIKLIQVSEVLYEFDGPQVFTMQAGEVPILFYKIDQIEKFSMYVAAPTNTAIVADLLAGKISLRSALVQTCNWVVIADGTGAVADTWAVNGQLLPSQILPEPGYGLYYSHGIVQEEVALPAQSFMSFHFSGGRNSAGKLSLGVLKQHVERAYNCVWTIISESALESDNNLTENMLRRTLEIPTASPTFASLHLSLDKPKLDLSEYKETQVGSKAVDVKKVEAAVEAAFKSFLSSAREIAIAIDQNRFSSSVAGSNAEALEAINSLVPNRNSFFESMEIRGNIKSPALYLKVDRQSGDTIREVYNEYLASKKTFKGKIVEINVPSRTFIIQRRTGRKITCVASLPKLKDRVLEFSTGQEAEVTGTYLERKLRDKLFYDQLVVDGEHIMPIAKDD